MTTAQEYYATARNTSNLKSDPRTTHSASDVLTAAGWTGQEHGEAMALWAVAFRGKTSAKLALVDLLSKSLTNYMLANSIHGSPKHIAMEVVAWVLHGRCEPCSGRGYEVHPDTPMLSDTLCPVCCGTGKVHFPQTDAHLWLKQRVEKMTAIAASSVMAKLASDMELK